MAEFTIDLGTKYVVAKHSAEILPKVGDADQYDVTDRGHVVGYFLAKRDDRGVLRITQHQGAKGPNGVPLDTTSMFGQIVKRVADKALLDGHLGVVDPNASVDKT